MNYHIFKKLFWNIGTLIAFIFTILLLIPQLLSHPKGTDWSSIELTLISTINVVIFLLGTLVLNLIIEFGNILNPDTGIIRKQIDTWRNEQQGNLSGIIDTRFVETIQKFAETHQGFINGMYDNYPHNFTHIFDKNSENYDELKNGTRSLYIWMKNVNVQKYADFARALLITTKHSVYSTTYYDNKDFIEVLTNDESNVVKWIIEVNEKNTDGFEVKRVHMFKNNGFTTDGTKYTTTKDIDDFVSLIKEKSVALKNYVELYINKSDEYKVWCDFQDILFYGEYLIFDNQIMIKYDEDFKTLELYVGKIVKEHSESFNLPVTHYKPKEFMLNKLHD